MIDDDEPGEPGKLDMAVLGSILHRLADIRFCSDENLAAFRAWKAAGRPGPDHPLSIALEASHKSSDDIGE